MTPTDFLFHGLYHACDELHDQGVDAHDIDEKVIGIITEDVFSGVDTDHPESAYLDVRYDDDDNEIRFTCGELRAVFSAVMIEFCNRNDTDTTS